MNIFIPIYIAIAVVLFVIGAISALTFQLKVVRIKKIINQLKPGTFASVAPTNRTAIENFKRSGGKFGPNPFALFKWNVMQGLVFPNVDLASFPDAVVSKEYKTLKTLHKSFTLNLGVFALMVLIGIIFVNVRGIPDHLFN